MQYDKDSFLAGIAVGRQLKGWSTAGSGRGIILQDSVIVHPQPTSHEVYPDPGYDGIAMVLVPGEINLVPANIKKDVSIYGVVGSYKPVTPAYRSEIKSVTVVSNGVSIIRPSSTYDGIGLVNLTVNVPSEINNAPSQRIVPTSHDQPVSFSSPYTGLSGIIVAGDSNLQSANIKSGVRIFGVDGSWGGEYTSEEKIITPEASTRHYYPSSASHRITKITVNGSSELRAGNIRDGVQIFGVTGSFKGEPQDILYVDKTIDPKSYEQDFYPPSGHAFEHIHVNTSPNLNPNNIKRGTQIFNVVGTYESPMSPLTVSLQDSGQVIRPTGGDLGFSEVIVEPVSVGWPPEWEGTQAEYDALETIDLSTIYYILEEEEETNE